MDNRRHLSWNNRRFFASGIFVLMLCCVLLSACGKGEKAVGESAFGADSVVGMPVTECLVKTTPVKDQGRSNLCWVYAMLATIESEHLMQGDSVNLSPLFIARMFLQEQAEAYYLAQGGRHIGTRGMASTLLRLMRRYGITHYDAFHGEVNLNVLARKTEKVAAACLAKRSGIAQLRERVDDLLDEQMRTAPQYVFMLGAEYTTQEFAHSVCRDDEYVALTSFTHHPFYRETSLELPDNYYKDTFWNVPLDTLMHHVEQALRSGHPVCWEGDVSESGFSFARGIGRLADEGRHVTQEMRQRMFERFQTTDDHSMELVGIARSPKGKKYYVCKNSWGTGNAAKGFVYLSEEYLRAKTIAVWMSRDALRGGLAEKIPPLAE